MDQEGDNGSMSSDEGPYLNTDVVRISRLSMLGRKRTNWTYEEEKTLAIGISRSGFGV